MTWQNSLIIRVHGCFQFVASTSSPFYYRAVAVRCLYCPSIVKGGGVDQLFSSSHTVYLYTAFSFSFAQCSSLLHQFTSSMNTSGSMLSKFCAHSHSALRTHKEPFKYSCLHSVCRCGQLMHASFVDHPQHTHC